MPPLRLYLVAGEASGDTRGAELIRTLRELHPGPVEFRGFGGPQMAALSPGGGIRDWIARAAVIGVIDVVKNYPFFKKQFATALREIASEQPDAVVLIDYPGFNLRLAAALKRAGSRAKIIDYISPQVWAWNRGRIPGMARILDLMICIFPFEQPLYEQSGLRAVFAGHPMLDTLAEKRIATPREDNLLGLLPGSRDREVRKIFPVMLDTAARLLPRHPGLRVEAAAASEAMLHRMREIAAGRPTVPCDITLGGAHSLMQRATAGMVASGTATLEAAFFGLPFALLYRAAWLTFALGRRLVKVRWLGMPNILAGREIVREFLQEDALPAPIADHLSPLLSDAKARESLQSDLHEAIAKLGTSGAALRAAAAILECLAK